jgi:SAM-dependent methyltransferase
MLFGIGMSVSFYNQNAQRFAADTLNVDMSALYEHFLPLLGPGAHIIDAGCGSGRDASYFLKLGYQVTAFDASKEMATLASKHTGLDVLCCEFMQFHSDRPADAIWACASLLHILPENLTQTFCHLASMLKPAGVFYCSFKLGEHDITKEGRYFTNMTMERLGNFIPSDLLAIKNTWLTADARPGREQEQWLNVMMERIST